MFYFTLCFHVKFYVPFKFYTNKTDEENGKKHATT